MGSKKKWELQGYMECPKCDVTVYLYCDGRKHKARLTKIKNEALAQNGV